MRYLLDTNVLSEGFQAHPQQGVMDRLARFQHQSVTAAPVWHELLFGWFRLPPSSRRDRLARYLREVVERGLHILPYDELAAERHAKERALLAAGGENAPFVDGQIAAIALTQGLVLVTRNVRDFRVFEGLVVEDWFSN